MRRKREMKEGENVFHERNLSKFSESKHGSCKVSKFTKKDQTVGSWLLSGHACALQIGTYIESVVKREREGEGENVPHETNVSLL